MKKRKYTDVEIEKKVNVTSSFHYWVDVCMRQNGGMVVKKDFLLNTQAFVGRFAYLIMPNYVINEVMNQLRSMNANRGLVFYEFNRDGQRRYKNLRYHSQELIDTLLGQWSYDEYRK